MAVLAGAAPSADRRPHGVLHAEIPDYKPLSVSGYHIREAGSTAAQELAFTLADGFGYVELGLSRGLDIDSFAPGLSFFFDAHIDFFEEIAKFRAARRIWARWMRDVYGAKTAKAQWLRFHTQTAGVSLTAQQPDNNIVRTAVEALAAVLGGTNSLHTNALDEVLALPSEKAARDRAAYAAGDRGGDRRRQRRRPAGWFLVRRGAHRRDRGQAEEIFANIQEMSGGPDADHKIGMMTAACCAASRTAGLSEIAEAAFQYQQAVEKGEKKIIGVNVPHRRRSRSRSRSCGSATRSRVTRASARRAAGRSATTAADSAAVSPDGRGGADAGNLVPGHARRGPRGGDAGRDLRRAA